MQVDASELVGNDRLKRRLVVGEGLNRRVVFYDNAVGTIASSALAQLITSNIISAMGNHAKEESHRPNDCIFLCTMNGAAVDRDMATRTFLLKLEPPTERDPAWEPKVRAYIQEHRWSIIAYIIDRLQAEPQFEVKKGATRFARFEREVVSHFCADQEEFDRVMKVVVGRQQGADEESAEWDEFAFMIDNYVEDLKPNRSGLFGLTNGELRKAWMELTQQTGISDVSFGKQLSRARTQGLLPKLVPAPNGKVGRGRGWYWRKGSGTLDPEVSLNSASTRFGRRPNPPGA